MISIYKEFSLSQFNNKEKIPDIICYLLSIKVFKFRPSRRSPIMFPIIGCPTEDKRRFAHAVYPFTLVFIDIPNHGDLLMIGNLCPSFKFQSS